MKKPKSKVETEKFGKVALLTTTYLGEKWKTRFQTVCRKQTVPKHLQRQNWQTFEDAKTFAIELDNAIRTGEYKHLLQEETYSSIEKLFMACSKVLSIDFQSPYVDFVAKHSYHECIAELINFVSDSLSCRFQIDHTYMPFEYCIHIFKDDEVLKPNNTYRA